MRISLWLRSQGDKRGGRHVHLKHLLSLDMRCTFAHEVMRTVCLSWLPGRPDTCAVLSFQVDHTHALSLRFRCPYVAAHAETDTLSQYVQFVYFGCQDDRTCALSSYFRCPCAPELAQRLLQTVRRPKCVKKHRGKQICKIPSCRCGQRCLLVVLLGLRLSPLASVPGVCTSLVANVKMETLRYRSLAGNQTKQRHCNNDDLL
ncbi:hypothetical protein NDU88_005864 [Pleurodeles waltl]|uniref:Uncharacterized protein n=1 Tax=Pleurodeles waltl TaxID=8319 RepID=A0AAV7MXK6_PLEWA|nr:hypothetical protein NDU88_005864 [Pleurodeles waltl]